MGSGFINSAVMLKEIATPGELAGHGKVYTKDGKLYFLDESGDEYCIAPDAAAKSLTLEDGAGSVLLNYDDDTNQFAIMLTSGAKQMRLLLWPADALKDDFLNPLFVAPNLFSETPWHVISGGTVTTDTARGIITIATSAVENNEAFIRTQQKCFNAAVTGWYSCFVNIPNPEAKEFDFRFGLAVEPGDNDHLIQFQAVGDGVNPSTWFVECKNGVIGATKLNTGISASGKHLLHMQVTSDAVLFYIDGTYFGYIANYIPTDDMYLTAYIQTLESSSNSFDLDKIMAFVRHDTSYWPGA